MASALVLRNPGDVYSLINSGRLRPRRATTVAAVAAGAAVAAVASSLRTMRRANALVTVVA